MQYQDRKLCESDNDGNLYKGIMMFMIVGLKKNVPLVLKAIPQTKIKEKWISLNIKKKH